MGTDHNLLVISDLHLGEDLGTPTPSQTRHVDETEQALANFLAHYAERPADGRPWKLIINGDMVDFLSVSLRPEDAGVEGDEDAEQFGLGASEAAAIAKFHRVAERHKSFFEGLGRFVQSGNEIHVVTGNHDAEFHFGGVRDAFRATVQTYCEQPLAERLKFHAWFFVEPGMAYLEHGHQYDPFCSFDDPLTPEDPQDERNLEENLGTAAMRYLGNHLPVDPDATNDLSFVEYLHLIANAREGLLTKFVDGYAAVIRTLAGQWWVRVRHPGRLLERRKRRKERMQSLADVTGLDRKWIEKLHGLRRPPVFVDLLSLIRSVMLGRLVTAALLPLFLLVPLFFWFWYPFQVVLASWFGVLCLFVALQVWLASGRANVDPTEAMRKTAAKIRRLMRAPIIVFGHSHIPLAHRLPSKGWYFNTGSWAGGADRSTSFTYLMLTRTDRRVAAALCRWTNGRSRELRTESARQESARAPGTSTGY